MTVIRTEFWPKPIPVRQFDWSATWDNYEPGAYVGFGRTEQEAMRDLIDNAPVEECFRPGAIIEWQGDGFNLAPAFHPVFCALIWLGLSVALWAAIVWLGMMLLPQVIQ